MGTSVRIPLEELTNRQLHLHLIGLLDRQAVILNRLDSIVSNLPQSLDDLTAAVDAVAARFNDVVDPLVTANADLRTQVQQLIDSDVIEDAEQAAALQAAMDAQDAAAERIQEQVTELNAIGSGSTEEPGDGGTGEEPPADGGDTPTDPVTGETPAEPAPADPNA